MKRHLINDHGFNNFVTSDNVIHNNYNLVFCIQKNINFQHIDETSYIFTILDTKTNLIFIKWFIQNGLLKQHLLTDTTEQADICRNKALHFVILGTHNNNFNINIYNKKENNFGKYTLLNKLKDSVNYCNTLAIPLILVYNIRHTSFNIDITIYDKNSKKIKLNDNN